ncbi:MAG: HAD-IIIC family phosphatase [Thermodesulfobacteriota bacterium]|nr:HAD-IIIC family phosphatase [Thermodesulfobacteriota bacterium]
MGRSREKRFRHSDDRKRSVKCVVWDLDNTIWNGVLLENDRLSLRENVRSIIKTLDNRGILQSIVSKNSLAAAMKKLSEFGLDEYFLHPQIGWNSKASSIKHIARSLNIGTDAMAFIDDQPFEREEVTFSFPEVLCVDAKDLDRLLDMPEMNPGLVSEDSKMRRSMYMSDLSRQSLEQAFDGPKEAFLASLHMVLTIFPAGQEDLLRAEELTVRTHQLNTTGYTYSYEELDRFRQSKEHILLMARLEDKFGPYGHIGLALVRCKREVWTIKLLLMSCRVMSRGIGSIILSQIMTMAKKKGVRLRAEYMENGRNRMMHITYRFAGFYEIERQGEQCLFENDLTNIQPFPDYVGVRIDDRSV